MRYTTDGKRHARATRARPPLQRVPRVHQGREEGGTGYAQRATPPRQQAHGQRRASLAPGVGQARRYTGASTSKALLAVLRLEERCSKETP